MSEQTMGYERLEHESVDCPTCGAPAGYPCNAPTEGEPAERPCPAREPSPACETCGGDGALLGQDPEGTDDVTCIDCGGAGVVPPDEREESLRRLLSEWPTEPRPALMAELERLRGRAERAERESGRWEALFMDEQAARRVAEMDLCRQL